MAYANAWDAGCNSEKELSKVSLYSEYTRALTFQNFSWDAGCAERRAFEPTEEGE
jgi:hypothetical protein